MRRASVPARPRPLRDPHRGPHLAPGLDPPGHGRGRLGLLRLGGGVGAPRPHYRPREPAPREHLPSPALHSRHGRACARDHAPGPAPLALHPGRGLHLQPSAPRDFRLVRLDRLLARPRARLRRGCFSLRGRRVRVLSHSHGPDRPSLDPRHPVAPRARALHAPLRTHRARPRCALGRALLPARVPGLRVSRRDRPRGVARGGARALLGPPSGAPARRDPRHRARRPRPPCLST